MWKVNQDAIEVSWNFKIYLMPLKVQVFMQKVIRIQKETRPFQSSAKLLNDDQRSLTKNIVTLNELTFIKNQLQNGQKDDKTIFHFAFALSGKKSRFSCKSRRNFKRYIDSLNCILYYSVIQKTLAKFLYSMHFHYQNFQDFVRPITEDFISLQHFTEEITHRDLALPQ